MWGMQLAVAQLSPQPRIVLIDGNRAPELAYETRTIVAGDRLEPAISAASILAKVSRDRHMLDLHQAYPQYGFNQHKGYPTKQHLQQLALHGPCAEHRRSFAPVRQLLQMELLEKP
jgi:ribonuclease HII